MRKEAWLTASRVRNAAALLVITFLLVAMQFRSGAFTADLALDPDEPAHAVSSLVVHDYLAQAFPHNPIAFSWNFYAHYSKVSIGHWPPLFYCVEAVWMLFAGRSKIALLLFITLCAATLAGSMYLEVQRRASTAAAVVSVAVLLSSRIFHQMLCGVHPDVLLTLMVFWAAIHCAEWMRFGLRRNRNLFLAFAIAAMLVHGRGGVLVLLPFILLPLRPKVARWQWLLAAVVAAVVIVVPPLLHQAPPNSLAAVPTRVRDFLLSTSFLTGWPWKSYALDGVSFAAGWPWAILAACGLPLVFRKGPQQQFWAAMAGIVLCHLCFYLLVAVPLEYRFLLSTMQAVAVLAGGGVEVLLRANLPHRKPLRLALCAAAVGWMVFACAHVEAKPDLKYGQMVATCLLCSNDPVLIAGDERSEGALIVESSLVDPRREHTVLRASKLLAISGWTGWNRRRIYASSAEVLHSLDEAHVSLVILQTSCTFPQVVQLRSALAQDPADWQFVHKPAQVDGTEIYVKTAAQNNPPK